MGNFVTSPRNEAYLIAGPRGTRVAVGQTAFKLWCIERLDKLPLELMTLELRSRDAETSKGVRVNVTSVAQVRVDALNVIEAENGDRHIPAGGNVLNKEKIMLAAQHFLGSSNEEVRESLRRTLEGHQRQILGTLTVEEVYKDRAAFSSRVRENVDDDLGMMGFNLVSYTVTEIDDSGGYMEALGQSQTALVKREAAEGTSRNESEAKKRVAEYEADAERASAVSRREAHVEVNTQREEEAKSDHYLELKRAEYNRLVFRAREEAEAAGRIEKAKQNQEVIRQETQQKYVEAEIELQITDKRIEREQKEKEGTARASYMAQEQEALAIKVMAKAEGDKIREIGEANAEATLADGKAKAEVLRLRAEAFKQYGDAAVVEMIMERLPQMTREIAQPLAKAEKLVFISNDGRAMSNLTGDITNILTQLPATVHGLTGFDFNKALRALNKGNEPSSTDIKKNSSLEEKSQELAL